MTQITEAIYTHGVLKPTEELNLREELFSDGRLPSRAELHDRS
jgi:hypothetical protein